MLLFISPLFISLFVPLSLRSCNKIAGFLTSDCLLAFQMDLRDIPFLSRSRYTSNSPTFQNAKWLGTNHDYKCGKHLCLLLTTLGIFCCKLYLQTVITLPKAEHFIPNYIRLRAPRAAWMVPSLQGRTSGYFCSASRTQVRAFPNCCRLPILRELRKNRTMMETGSPEMRCGRAC